MSSHPTAYSLDAGTRTGRTAVREAALAVGVVLLLAGLLTTRRVTADLR